ncbi:MAG: metalloregulator ArsR/SmtB family transcription factor [Patescibacteria group bacterium]
MKNKSFEEKIINRAERVFKGGANKNRLRILDYLNREDNTSVWMISQNLNLDFRNTSQHLQRLEKAGLVNKHHQGQSVYHQITPFGQKLLEFMRNLK